MIFRKNRFHGHNSLKYVYQHGKTVRSPLCALRFVHNPRRSSYRAAVVVSKKMHKSAVVRNRIRRRLYEIVRTHVAEAAAYDMVFTVFSDQLADMPAEKVRETMLDLLHDARIPTKQHEGVRE